MSMNSDPDLWLQLAARFTIISSVLVIISFFVFTAWRITRFQNNPWPWWTGVGQKTGRREIHQIPTTMPFTFRLKEDSVNEVNQLTFRMHCQERPFSIRLLWVVDASYLFKLINSPSWGFIDELKEHTPTPESEEISNSLGSVGKPFVFANSLHLKLSDNGQFDDDVTVVAPAHLNWIDLRHQYKYPLAIFIQKSSVGSRLMDPASSIVGLCVILHVKNDIIPKSTTVLAQYIKLDNGQTHLLQSLYVMDSGNQEDEIETKIHDKSDSESIFPPATIHNQPFSEVLCSVCQTLPVSRAIIPCRHVCLCAHCFGKVHACPICRGIITCYFKTRDESYMRNFQNLSNTGERETTRLPEERSWGEILTTLNENVNTAFGLDE